MEINLCHPGAKCPKVITKKDAVEIGEKGNLATLKPEEWNTLVDAIKDGRIGRI